MALKLVDIAEQTGARLVGDGDCLIEGVAEITSAEKGAITFISNANYLKYLDGTRASAVILKNDALDACNIPALVTDDPRLIYAKAVNLLFPARNKKPGVSSGAIIAENAIVDKLAFIDSGVIIQSGARISDGAEINAGCVVGANVSIGENSILYSNVTIYDGCTIGDNSIIHSGAIIGADGFGFVKDGDSYLKIPQLGFVRIGNNVEIGANTTLDRGAIEDTVIDNGVKIDNQVQIAHSVSIGKNTVISAATAIAGSTKIGSNCLIGGCVGIVEHLTIANDVIITGRTMVTRSITQSGSYSSSTPMDTTGNWRKNSARFRKLDELAKRVNRLERTINNDATDR